MRRFNAGFAVGSWLVCALALGCVGCDREPSRLEQLVEASAETVATVTAAPKPSAPTPPSISVDDSGCNVNGELILFSAADARERIAALLMGKPLVLGQALVVDASREAKTPRVMAALAALRTAKAKSALVRTPTRDKTMGELAVLLAHGKVADCTAVGMVSRDGSIAVWHAAGGTAQKFTRGMAGPDLTLGSEALRKASASCDASAWVVGADDNIPWGLAFDFAMASRGSVDAGATLRATETLVATEAPVAGRKISAAW